MGDMSAMNLVPALSPDCYGKVAAHLDEALGSHLDEQLAKRAVQAVHDGYAECGYAVVVVPAEEARHYAEALDLAADLLSDSDSDAQPAARAASDLFASALGEQRG